MLEFTAGAATRAPALAPALGFFLPFDRVLAFLGLLTSGISGVVGLVPILLAPIAGAVRGFVAGFMFPLFGGLVVPGGLEVVLGIVASRVLTGFIVAILWVVLATMLEPATVRLSGARDLSRREKARLLPLMQQCVEKLNLERHPMLMVSDERIISAWATNTRIVFTRGFLERFWRDQEAIGGVLAHELQHWASGQTMGQQFVWALALPIGILNGLYYEVVSRVKHPVVQYALALFAWPLSFMLRFMVAPTWAHENRRQEFECDQAAVRAGYREGLYRVLRVYRDFEGGAGGWNAVVPAGHPPAEFRLERLEGKEVVDDPTASY